MVKKNKTTDLAITALEVGGCIMSLDIVNSSTEKEAKMKAHDTYVRERSEAMNSLEAYVYDLRSRIDEYGGDLKEFGPTSVREKLKKDLDASEEWIYSEEAEQASKSTFVERKQALINEAAPLLMRKKEFDERPVRMKVFESTADSFKQFAMSTEEDYAHIEQEQKDKVLKCVETASIWLKTEKAKQETIPRDQDPVLTCDMISKKLKEVVAECDPIRKTPKPAPKEEPKEKADDGQKEKAEETGEDKMETDNTAEAGKDEAAAGNGNAVPTPEAKGSEQMETDTDKNMNGESNQDGEMN